MSDAVYNFFQREVPMPKQMRMDIHKNPVEVAAVNLIGKRAEVKEAQLKCSEAEEHLIALMHEAKIRELPVGSNRIVIKNVPGKEKIKIE